MNVTGMLFESPVYHGTRENFRAFYFRPLTSHPSSMGIWFTASSKVAQGFAKTKLHGYDDPSVVEVNLHLENPKVFQTWQDLITVCQEHGSIDAKRLRRRLIRQGFDGIEIVDCNTDGLGSRTDYVAFYRHQIKIVGRTVVPENQSF